MANSDPSPSCPTVPTPRRGTVGQTLIDRDTRGTSGGTGSLKALARHVLLRDNRRDNGGTVLSEPVPPIMSTVRQAECEKSLDADDAWSARAAIAEHDGGLTRADAEMVADADHPPAAGDAPPADWRRWHATALSERSGRMSEADASRRTWGEALNLWHLHHGARADPSLCAGCGGPLGSLAWTLPDGARVHDDRRAVECLSAYGERWRFAAAAALARLGIPAPDDAP